MKDKCVLCGEVTPYDIEMNITYRNFYIEGSGQLCERCYRKIYGDQMTMKCPECGKDLGQHTSVDIDRIGWNCSDCQIKVYKMV